MVRQRDPRRSNKRGCNLFWGVIPRNPSLIHVDRFPIRTWRGSWTPSAIALTHRHAILLSLLLLQCSVRRYRAAHQTLSKSKPDVYVPPDSWLGRYLHARLRSRTRAPKNRRSQPQPSCLNPVPATRVTRHWPVGGLSYRHRTRTTSTSSVCVFYVVPLSSQHHITLQYTNNIRRKSPQRRNYF